MGHACCSGGHDNAANERLLPLTQLRVGQTGVIREAKLSVDDSALLEAMGLCDRATVKLCRVGEPCIVAVGGVVGHDGKIDASKCTCGGSCRIGLARPLAERIMVSVVGAEARQPLAAGK